jgi:hypothetical protein
VRGRRPNERPCAGDDVDVRRAAVAFFADRAVCSDVSAGSPLDDGGDAPVPVENVK